MKNYRKFLSLTVILLTILLTLSIAYGQSEEGEPGILTNPLNVAGGPDPWLVYYEGYYYLSATTGRSNLVMRRSETLAGLKTATPIEIYAETDPSRCCNMWAPEFYLLEDEDGELHWYYYYSAGTSGTLDNQRTHVLESEGTDPMGPYTYKARIFDAANDMWAIDGSILELNDELYFLFSSWNGPNQNMYIAPMSNPWTISGERVLLSTPEYDWERSGLNVNEGPVALYHDDDVFIIYSASFCATADYKLGMITYLGGDPLDPASWEKHPEPVFERNDENGVFGPGHNGFFMSPDGTENWIVYHANDSASGVCDDRRNTRVQPFTWNQDGTPNFGEPVALGEEIDAPSGDEGIDPIPDFASLPVSMFRSYSFENGYLRHSDIYTRVDVSITPIEDAHFMLVPGLADPEAVSIVSVNLGGYYLRHEGNTIVFAPSDGSEEFAGDATWWLRPGLADSEWISIESYNQPNFYVGQMFGVMALVELTDSLPDRAREDATFMQEEN
jgi:GH43 family beta-xylosidase